MTGTPSVGAPSAHALGPVSLPAPASETAAQGHAPVVLVPVQEPEPPPGKGPEFGNASPVGLVVVLLLLIATALLIRSMSKRIRRLPESFDEDGPDELPDQRPDDAQDDGAAGDGGTANGESGDGSAAGSSRPGAR